ncbi:unnamed protein product [Closterium sp. Naga37s-1]|nr:unnamed protein product [Closterium sp. Naga37s-1]
MRLAPMRLAPMRLAPMRLAPMRLAPMLLAPMPARTHAALGVFISTSPLFQRCPQHNPAWGTNLCIFSSPKQQASNPTTITPTPSPSPPQTAKPFHCCARSPPQPLNFGGVASTESRVNPVFYNWNFVLLKYCDGASFAGSAFGRPAKAHAPSNRGSSHAAAAAAAAAVGGAEAAEAGGSGDPQTLFYMGHWNLQAAMQDLLVRGEMAQGTDALVGGCSAGGRWQCLWYLLARRGMNQGTDALVGGPAGAAGHESGDRRADLLVRRGMNQGTDALVGGCSAGAVAVSMVCDPIAAWLARFRIRTKCFMDAGVFPDVVDYYGQRSLRRKVQRMAGAQNINRAGISYSCKQSLGSSKEAWNPLSLHPPPLLPALGSSKEAWKCFFPEYNLNFVRTPMFLVNSLLDYKAVAIALAPRSKTRSNPLLRCMRSPRFSSCSALQLRLLRDFSHRVNSTIYGIVRTRAAARVPFRAFTFSASTHCVIGSSYWSSLRMGMRDADGGGGEGGGGGSASALGVSVRDVKDIVGAGGEGGGGGGVSDVMSSSGFEGGFGGGFGGGSREATLEGRFTDWYFS